MAEDWISRFVLKDAKADLSQMTLQQYARIAHASVQEYDSMIGTRSGSFTVQGEGWEDFDASWNGMSPSSS